MKGGLALLVILLATAVLAACGSTGVSEEQDQEVRGYVSAICDPFITYIEPQVRLAGVSAVDSREEMLRWVRELKGASEAFLQELTAIAPPGSMVALHEEMLGVLATEADMLGSVERALTTGSDEEARQSILALGEHLEQSGNPMDEIASLNAVSPEFRPVANDAWEEVCWPRVKERFPEAELP